MSRVGFKIGNVWINGLMFADDLVLLASSASGLRALLKKVKDGFDELELSINPAKSQIISPENAESWEFFNSEGEKVLSLKRTALYKYLGTWTYDSMYKTAKEKVKQCIQKAENYRDKCKYVSKFGPDRVDVIECTWLNVALPTILSGTEMIPFLDSEIEIIERIQSQVCKFALGVHISSPNICSQSEMGMKYFRQYLYEHQLKFYFRVLGLPSSRWVHQAMMDHLSGEWMSPYFKYICDIRTRLGIISVPLQKIPKSFGSEYFLNIANEQLALSGRSDGISSFKRQPYVRDCTFATTIAQFKLGSEYLGNKTPRTGYTIKVFCPLCPTVQLNCGSHLLLHCSSISSLRKQCGVQTFINGCKILRNLSDDEIYKLFINGYDVSGNPITVFEYLHRGKILFDLREKWLSCW